MDKKAVIVTGGSSGVGLECAKYLVRQGYEVIITGRNVDKGTAVAKSIGALFLELELTSSESICKFIAELPNTTQSPIHHLICNAGLQQITSVRAKDTEFEVTWAANHLGHFILVQRLLPHLARPAKIILVASGTHDPEQQTGIEPPRFSTAEKVAKGEFEGSVLAGMKYGHCAYSTSKLCNILFAFELQRQLSAREINDITVNAFDPGLTPGTSLVREGGFLIDFAFRHLPAWLLQRFLSNVHSVDQSGTSLAVLATSAEYENESGRYYEHENLKPFVARSSVDSLSLAKAKDLWDYSFIASGIPLSETLFG